VTGGFLAGRFAPLLQAGDINKKAKIASEREIVFIVACP
jgi:hypothetical protein